MYANDIDFGPGQFKKKAGGEGQTKLRRQRKGNMVETKLYNSSVHLSSNVDENESRLDDSSAASGKVESDK